MHRFRHLVLLAVYGGWTLLVACEAGAAEGNSHPSDADLRSTRAGRTAPVWQPQRPARRVAARTTVSPWREQADPPRPREDADGPELILPGGKVYLEPLDHQGPVVDHEAFWIDHDALEHSGPAIVTDFLGGRDVADGCVRWAVHNLQVFAGVHGFKGPTDLGRNGNFGFHEGVNWGAPIGDPWGYGYQVGFQAVHSNFAGNQALQTGPLARFSAADRNQVFFTAAFFQRPQDGGLQSGMAFDLFYDSYYYRSTLFQIRSETAWVLSDLREIGYWGAYGLTKDSITGAGQFDTLLDPTDLFAFFYRRRFTGGGHGRVWAGVSGNGDAIFGLDGSVPLGTNWALDNNFTCLFPKQGRGTDGQTGESWSVSIQLVWYPGRTSRPIIANPYHPLFYVADNSWFLVDRRR